jgi:hypothetical protein
MLEPSATCRMDVPQVGSPQPNELRRRQPLTVEQEEQDGVAYGVAAAEENASHPARRSPQAGQLPQP